MGSGSRKNGRATILYDPKVSQRGALMAAARQPRASTLLDFCAPPTLAIYNPNALPLFREDLPGQRKKRGKDAELEEARRRHKPDPGSSRLGAWFLHESRNGARMLPIARDAPAFRRCASYPALLLLKLSSNAMFSPCQLQVWAQAVSWAPPVERC